MPTPLRLKSALLALLLLGLIRQVDALTLPLPDELEQATGLSRQTVAVMDPLLSTPQHPVKVSYVGWPMQLLLSHWFGDKWQAADAEVVFLAKDGYRSVVAASKLKSYPTYLVFARSDGQPFALNDHEQKETVALGPYYLVWDNLKAPELASRGPTGWAYQVDRIELHQSSDNQSLKPIHADAVTLQGLADTETNCLTCHKLGNIGGEKYPLDLAMATCRFSDADLQQWILEPGQIRPGTTMPGLNRTWPETERKTVAGRIVAYLAAVRQGDAAICGGQKR